MVARDTLTPTPAFVADALPVGACEADELLLPVAAAIAALPKMARPVASNRLWGGAGTTSAAGTAPDLVLVVPDAVPPAVDAGVQAAVLAGVPPVTVLDAALPEPTTPLALLTLPVALPVLAVPVTGPTAPDGVALVLAAPAVEPWQAAKPSVSNTADRAVK